MISLSDEVSDTIIISGGLVAFGSATILLFLMDYIIPLQHSSNNIIIQLFRTLSGFLISGAITGYLISNNTINPDIKIGIKTGLVAFLINLLYMTLYSSFQGALWALIGYTVGGALGCYLWGRMKIN